MYAAILRLYSKRLITAYIYTTVCLQWVISGAWLPRYIAVFQMAGSQMLLIMHTQTLVMQ